MYGLFGLLSNLLLMGKWLALCCWFSMDNWKVQLDAFNTLFKELRDAGQTGRCGLVARAWLLAMLPVSSIARRRLK
jgi:hypothetical protein